MSVLVSVLHPTRRPQRALSVRSDWMAKSADPSAIEWIFGVDEGGPDDPGLQPRVTVPPPTWDVRREGGTFCLAMNLLAKASTGQILFQMADDWSGPAGWDKWIRDSLGDVLHLPRLLTIVDHPSRPKGFDHCCFPCITRPMPERNGWFYWPEYRHVFTDTDLSDRTRKDGERVDVPQPHGFFHDHPVLTGARVDEVYQIGNSQAAYAHGEKIYQGRHGHS